MILTSCVLSGDQATECDVDKFNVKPKVGTPPLVFKYSEGKGDPEYTNVASFFQNEVLLKSPTVHMCWRVSYNPDEKDNSIDYMIGG